MSTSTTVLFLAFGTRGDVQPIAVLANALASAEPGWNIGFVTHKAHEGFLKARLESDPHPVRFFSVSTPPVLLRAGACQQPLAGCSFESRVTSPSDDTFQKAWKSSVDVNDSRMQAETRIKRKRQIVDRNADTHTLAEGSTQPRGGMAGEKKQNEGWPEDSQGVEDGAEEGELERRMRLEKELEHKHRRECLEAAQSAVALFGEDNSLLFVINMFALEGWHIAEKFRAPCIAASPYLIPYSAPASFERQFRKYHPHLYRRLKNAARGEQHVTMGRTCATCHTCMKMDAMAHGRRKDGRRREAEEEHGVPQKEEGEEERGGRQDGWTNEDNMAGGGYKMVGRRRWQEKRTAKGRSRGGGRMKRTRWMDGGDGRRREKRRSTAEGMRRGGGRRGGQDGWAEEENMVGGGFRVVIRRLDLISLFLQKDHSSVITDNRSVADSSDAPQAWVFPFLEALAPGGLYVPQFGRCRPVRPWSGAALIAKKGTYHFETKAGVWKHEMQALGLSAVPFTDAVTGRPVVMWPRSPMLLYGFSELVVECPGYWPVGTKVCGFWFPRGDREVISNGYAVAGEGGREVAERNANGDGGELPKSLSEFLGAAEAVDPHNTGHGEITQKPIYFGFGSIGSMGLLSNPGALLNLLVTTLEIMDRRGVLLTGGHRPLDQAVSQLRAQESTSLSTDRNDLRSKTGTKMGSVVGCGEHTHDASADWQREDECEFSRQREHRTCAATLDAVCNDEINNDVGDACLIGSGRLLCLSGSLSHRVLLPHFDAVVHHGGSGTTAAALRAGVPQVICPFLFDQFYWAERMFWIGVASEPLAPTDVMIDGIGMDKGTNEAQDMAERSARLVAALRQACTDTVRQTSVQLAHTINKEDGVSCAVGHITDFVHEMAKARAICQDRHCSQEVKTAGWCDQRDFPNTVLLEDTSTHGSQLSDHTQSWKAQVALVELPNGMKSTACILVVTYCSGRADLCCARSAEKSLAMALHGYRPGYWYHQARWKPLSGEGPWITVMLNYDGGDELRLKINVEGAKEVEMRTNSRLQDAITEARDRAERRCRRDGVTAIMQVTVSYHETETSMDTADREQAHLDRDSGGESEMSEAGDWETDLQSWNRPDQVRKNHPLARPVEGGPEASSRQRSPRGRGTGKEGGKGRPGLCNGKLRDSRGTQS
ncbi:hypothetical protein CBR_g32500 [Chara braunii]|uniref:Erythromycin biosynthesis protein CIII-like C-terminal domain-containing protein n=1 Tax=Chara braunii TaxID=69332 RepID=A0A388LGY2_CHABU|nr:hypothetical protein CBR_g32500 [Chara braunii]|eukprot:GBG81511.1 hypothetical protein CBR_g32500 [Chara braunii]